MDRPRLSPGQRQWLEQLVRETHDLGVYRRALAMLHYDDGRSVGEIAAWMRVTPRSVYLWMEACKQAFVGGTPINDVPRGRPPLWTDEHQALLRHLLKTPPDQLGYYAVNWTVPLLQEQIQRETGLEVSEDTVRRALRRDDYVWKRPRYVLQPDPDREKKASNPANRAGIGPHDGSVGRG